MDKQSTVNPREIAQFDQIAGQWWDEKGPFRPLHRLNPERMRFLRDQVTDHYGKVKGLSVLDIGCGGGLVCEPLARLGARVTGLDGGRENIEAARSHAKTQDLSIDYHAALAEDWAKKNIQYNVVLALEIIEHVKDPAFFVAQCVKLAKPGGLIVFSTLNRTAKSFAFGIVAAEYLLGWVPKGTHEWRCFVKPSELADWLEGAAVKNICGLRYNMLAQKFELSPDDASINYFLTAVKE